MCVGNIQLAHSHIQYTRSQTAAHIRPKIYAKSSFAFAADEKPRGKSEKPTQRQFYFMLYLGIEIKTKNFIYVKIFYAESGYVETGTVGGEMVRC